MDNPEKHNMCWTPLSQTNTNNINKTWTILQTIRGKDEPIFVYMRKSQYIIFLTGSIHFEITKIASNIDDFRTKFQWQPK